MMQMHRSSGFALVSLSMLGGARSAPAGGDMTMCYDTMAKAGYVFSNSMCNTCYTEDNCCPTDRSTCTSTSLSLVACKRRDDSSCRLDRSMLVVAVLVPVCIFIALLVACTTCYATREQRRTGCSTRPQPAYVVSACAGVPPVEVAAPAAGTTRVATSQGGARRCAFVKVQL